MVELYSLKKVTEYFPTLFENAGIIATSSAASPPPLPSACSVEAYHPVLMNDDHTRLAQKQLISATFFARPGWAAVLSKPDARDTVKWLTMPVYYRPRATSQRCCSTGACRKFLLSSCPCCGFVTSFSQLKFVAVVGPGSECFATSVHRLFSLFYWLSVGGTGSRRAVGPDDRPRRRVVRLSSFCLQELSTIRLEDNSPSRAKPPGG